MRNAGKTGMTWEERGKPSIYAGNGGISGGTAPFSINNIEREGVGGGRRLFLRSKRHRRPTKALAGRSPIN